MNYVAFLPIILLIISGYVYVRRTAPRTAKVVEYSLVAIFILYGSVNLFGSLSWTNGAHEVSMAVAESEFFDGKAELYSLTERLNYIMR